MYKIEFYEEANGHSDITEYIKELKRKEQNKMTTWKTLRTELGLSEEDEKVIEMEKNLIKAMIQIREEKGLTQAQLAEMCDVKQPVIARMESSTHSPQIDSLLRILVPLGYTLQIVPMQQR